MLPRDAAGPHQFGQQTPRASALSSAQEALERSGKSGVPRAWWERPASGQARGGVPALPGTTVWLLSQEGDRGRLPAGGQAAWPGAVLVPRPHLAARGAEPERGPSPPTSPPREQRRPVRTSRPPASHRSPRPRAGAATRAPGCPARWRQGLCVARRSPGSSRPVLLSPCSTSTASARSRARPPGSRPAPRGVSRSPSPERPEDASLSARTPERPARARAL